MSGWIDGLLDSHKKKKNLIVGDFINNNKLIDIWRTLNKDKRQFTWFKPNGKAKSRIDYWLTSNSILHHVTEANISNSPLSDHCIISLKLTKSNTSNKSKGYWKFNANLLTNMEYCSNIKNIILDIKKDDKLATSIQKWEYLKFTIRKYSITFSRKLNREKKADETKLVKELLSYNSKLNWSAEDKDRINNLQSQLDEIYLNKAQGAYIRSRARWIENGEKNTSYFSNLEKRRQEKDAIYSLIINGEECTEPKRVTREVMNYYSNLYTSSYSEQNTKLFFEKISNEVPEIDDSFREICEEDLRI